MRIVSLIIMSLMFWTGVAIAAPAPTAQTGSLAAASVGTGL